MYAIIFWDHLEYQYRPVFRDRDAGYRGIRTWATIAEAEKELRDYYAGRKARVVRMADLIWGER